MNISALTVPLFFGAFLAFAQPGMGPGMGPGGGPGRHFDNRGIPQEVVTRENPGQELWMNHKLHRDLSLTDLQRESLKTFLEDTANGLKASNLMRLQLQDALVEAFQGAAINEDLVKKIESDWIVSEEKWLRFKIKATRFFFSILSPSQKQRFWDLHEKAKADRSKNKGDQPRSPHRDRFGRN